MNIKAAFMGPCCFVGPVGGEDWDQNLPSRNLRYGRDTYVLGKEAFSLKHSLRALSPGGEEGLSTEPNQKWPFVLGCLQSGEDDAGSLGPRTQRWALQDQLCEPEKVKTEFTE